MEALYAFLRITDDLADQPAPASLRRQCLWKWRAALDAAFQQAGIPSWGGFDADLRVSEELRFQTPSDSKGPSSSEPSLAQNKLPLSEKTIFHASPVSEEVQGQIGSAELAIFPALVDTVREFQIPLVYLYAVVDGVGMDVDRVRYETFDELALYCRRVASAVGLACLCIWQCHRQEAVASAIACGLAFQLTNILRDLKEDARQGRIYLPAEELRAFGYSTDAFPPTQGDERFDRFMRHQLERVWQWYRQAADLWEYLDRSGRRIFGMMYETYRRIVQRISQDPQKVLVERIRLSGWEKLTTAVRWAFWPSHRWLLGGGADPF